MQQYRRLGHVGAAAAARAAAVCDVWRLAQTPRPIQIRKGKVTKGVHSQCLYTALPLVLLVNLSAEEQPSSGQKEIENRKSCLLHNVYGDVISHICEDSNRNCSCSVFIRNTFVHAVVIGGRTHHHLWTQSKHSHFKTNKFMFTSCAAEKEWALKPVRLMSVKPITLVSFESINEQWVDQGFVLPALIPIIPLCCWNNYAEPDQWACLTWL